jgi:hypothetical protein
MDAGIANDNIYVSCAPGCLKIRDERVQGQEVQDRINQNLNTSELLCCQKVHKTTVVIWDLYGSLFQGI